MVIAPERLRARLPLRQGLELVRDVLEEEGGKSRVVGGQLEEVLDRQRVADRLLADDEVVAARLVDQDLAVEAVAALVHRHDLVAGPLLHQPLDQHIEMIRQRPGARAPCGRCERTPRRRPG